MQNAFAWARQNHGTRQYAREKAAALYDEECAGEVASGLQRYSGPCSLSPGRKEPAAVRRSLRSIAEVAT